MYRKKYKDGHICVTAGDLKSVRDEPTFASHNKEICSEQLSWMWTSSTPSAGSFRVHGSLCNKPTCVLCTVEKAFDCLPR